MDLLKQIGEEIAAQVLEIVSSRIEIVLGETLKNIQLIYSEKEAANVLRVSKQTLGNYRKLGKINFSVYPPARIGYKTNNQEQWRNAIYTYTLADLLNFQAQYQHRKMVGKYEINQNISILGTSIKSPNN